jgi:hypothetical protein
MSAEYIVLGNFKGRFKTSQATALGLSESFPEDFEHKVQVYDGVLDQTTFEDRFAPQNYRKLSSFLFHNLPNVTIQGNAEGPFSDKRIYTFTQLMIIDPKVVRTYEMNNQTYGEIEGKAYGITNKNAQINRLDPPPVDADDNGGGNGSGIGGGGGSGGSSDFNEESEIGQTLNRAKSGCGTALSGCLTNFWRILLWLLFILFLLWLIRSCSQLAQDDGSCDRRDRHRELLKEEKKLKDSLQNIYDENVKKALANIKNVYFYQNSAEFHQYSLEEKGNLLRLAKLLKTCDDKSFYIVGNHSGSEIEEGSNLDARRAEAVKDYFVSHGVKESHLFIKLKADSLAFYPKELSNYMLRDYTIKKYNRNMRVYVQLKKK